MNPNSSLMKKRDEFKKQIRKDQLEKKRVDIRRGLPYYEPMFNKSEEDSNGTNSRSSRFPVPGRQARGQDDQIEIRNNQQQKCEIDNEGVERQCQMRYLDYLRGLGDTNQQMRRQKIIQEFTKYYGADCFDSMEKLEEQLSVDLMRHENELMDSSDEQTLSRLEWGFIQASLYFAQNQHLPMIRTTCLNLIASYLIPWQQASIQLQIVEEMAVDDFLNILKDVNEDIRVIEDLMLSHFISLSQENQPNQQIIQKIMGYFSQKLQMFYSLQNHLETHFPDHQQIPYFSQIFYDFPSLYFMQTLFQIVTLKQTSTQMKLQVFTLLNKYFSGYPLSVESGTQSNQKLRNFFSEYLRRLTTFFNLCLKGSQYIHAENYIQVIQSSLRLLCSIVMRDFGDEGVLVEVVVGFGAIVDIVVKLKIVNQILQCLDIHFDIMYCFTLLASIMDSMNSFFQNTAILDYLNTLLLNWSIFKCENRHRQTIFETSSQNDINFTKLEFFLIQCLYISKNNISHAHLTQTDQKWIQSMYNYADMVYEKQKSIMDELQKKGEHQIRGKQMFLFEENIYLYFKMMKGKEDVTNPETVEVYKLQDLEI